MLNAFNFLFIAYLRLRVLGQAALCFGVSFLILWLCKPENLYRLSVEGERSVGTVLDYEYRDGLTRGHRHLMAYDGHENWLDAKREWSVGSEVKLLYLKDEPGVAYLTRKEAYLPMVVEYWGLFPFLLLSGFSLIFVGLGVRLAREAFGNDPDVWLE